MVATITTAQDFINTWTELDALYVEITNADLNGTGGQAYSTSELAVFGDYADDRDFTITSDLTNTIAAGGRLASLAAAAGDGVTPVDLGEAALAVNLAFVEVANQYVEYLKTNPPILDIYKERGPGDPGQSLHDNILGNIGDSAIQTRFLDHTALDIDLIGDGDELDGDPRSPDAQVFGDRPYYDGYASHTSQKNASIEWDLENGVDLDGSFLAATAYDFETDTNGWYANGSTLSVEASGSVGVTSESGSSHARIVGDGAYTRFDGYRTDFGQGWSTEIKIYLDTSWADGEGFDYSVASNQQVNSHLRDFIFHVTKDTTTGDLLVGASNNTNNVPREDLETINHAVIASSGWYTFQHYFYETADGTLAAALSVFDSTGAHVFTEIRNADSGGADPDEVDTEVGGNRYGWFTANNVTGGIAVDSVSLQVSEPIGTIQYGGPGNDVLEGSPFDDTFIATAGNDTIDGLGGTDTYDLSNNTTGAFVDLGTDANGTGGFAFGGTETGIDNLTSIENVRGSSGFDVLNGSAADNTFFASAGNDQINGGEGGVNTYDASDTTSDVTIDLGAGTSSGSEIGSNTLANIQNAIGGAGNDDITGNSSANTLIGNGGDDDLTGGGDNDTLIGGAGIDTAHYADDYGDVGLATGSLLVNTLTEGNDTLEGVEKLSFGDGTTVYVVGEGSEYATIQAAIDAAELDGGANNVVLVTAGEYAESLSIGQGITILGLDGAVIKPTTGTAVTIEVGTDGDVTFDNIDLVGDGAATGIAVLAGANVGTLTFTNGELNDFATRGIYSTNDGDETTNPTLGNIVVTDSTFSGNGEGVGSNKEHIKLFGFEGDATFQDLTFTGAAPSTPKDDRPGNAIEIIGALSGPGSANGSPLGDPAIGTVVIDNVTITGEFEKNPVGIFNFGDISGLSISGLDLSGAVSDWGPLFNLDGITGDIDASTFDITYSAAPTNPLKPVQAELQGEKAGQGDDDSNITGSAAAELLNGKGGEDDLDGAGGDDILVGGADADTLDGGTGSDILFGNDAISDEANSVIDTAVYGAGATLSWNGTNWEVADGGDTDTLLGIEKVLIDGKTTLLVDQSANGGFSTIQEAIDAATAGGETILVADGTYREQVIAEGRTDLTISAVNGKAVTTIEMVDVPQMTHDDATDGGSKDRFAVVTVRDSSNVTIEDFTIDGRGLGDGVTGGSDFEGVLFFDASGKIDGLDVVRIRDVLNGDGTPKGNQRGNAIVVVNDDATVRNVEIADTGISDFQKNGISASGDGLVANIHGNTVTGSGFLPASTAIAQNGIQVSYGAGGVVDGNTITEIGYQRGDWVTTGILAYEAADGLQLINNIFEGATDGSSTHQPTTHVGIYLIGETDNAVVTGNQMDFLTFGIILSNNFDDPTLSGNTFTNMFASVTTNTGAGTWTGDNYEIYGGDNDNPLGSIATPLVLSDGVDYFEGTDFADVVDGGDGADFLFGGDGADDISGGGGNDEIDGGAGADTLRGGTGDDTYFVDSTDTVTEAVGEGTDTVLATGDFTLAAGSEVENLEAVAGAGDIDLTGNEFGQTITGNEGNNKLYGEGGDDTIDGGAGNDEIFGGSGVNTLNGDAGNDWFSGGNDVDTIHGGDGVDLMYGNGGDDQLFGDAGADTLYGMDGADTISGGDDNDTLLGGDGNDDLQGDAGTDRAMYFDDLTASDITANGTSWTVVGGAADDTDTLTGIEIVVADYDGGESAHRFLLVGSGGFGTLADAMAEALDGDTILLASGEYDGGVTIDKSVTIRPADGAVVTITGPLMDLIGSEHLDDYFTDNHPAYSGAIGLTISADNVSISGLTFSGFSSAIQLGTADGVSVTDNNFVDNVTGIRKGTADEVTNITINGNDFSHGIYGINTYAGIEPDGVGGFNGLGSFDQVTMNGNSFSDLAEKGMYFEQLSNVAATGNTFERVGNYGRVSPPFGGTDGEFGQAIDINLKYGNYANVVFTDTEITDSGNSDQDGAGTPGDFGAAIGIKTRDDGGYGDLPATFTGQITFNGGFIDGTSTGVRVGEPGKDNDGPDVLIDGMEISNATESDVDNATDPSAGGTTTVEMAAGQLDLDASASQAPVHVTGNDSDNVITGGSGDDDFTGGDGNDTYVVTANDVIHENASEGTDSVQSADSYTLSANVENLTLTGSADVDGTGNASDNEITGNTGNNVLTGLGGADTLDGGEGDDTLIGGDGDDTIHGGAGIDTAVIDDDLGNASFSIGSLLVNSADGMDTIDGVEVLQFNDARVLVVGEGSEYATLGAALADAADGDTILITAGTTLQEQVVIDGFTDLTIMGMGDTSIIEAPDVPVANTSSVGGVNAAAVISVINSTGIVIKDLAIDGRGVGDAIGGLEFSAVYAGNSDISIDDIDVTGIRDDYDVDGHVKGNQQGRAIYVRSDGTEPHTVSVTNSRIDDFQKNGIDIRGVDITATVTGNTITGDGLIPDVPVGSAMAQNGVVLGFGATGTVSGNTISEFGNDRADGVGPTGILIYQAADGVIVDDNDISGAEDGLGGYEANVSAGIYVFDSDNATVSNNTVTGYNDGVGASDNADGLSHSGNSFSYVDRFNLNVDGSDNDDAMTLSGTTGPDQLIGSDAADSLSGGDGDDTIDGGAEADTLTGGAGADTINGGDGNDALTGGGDNDTIDGGAGVDTAFFADTLSASDLAPGGSWNVTTATEGTDHLTDVEIVEDGSENRFLLVGSDGFATLGEALAEAEAGDTIIIAHNTVLTESVTVDVSVTILGAHAGTIGTDGARDLAAGVGESTLNGRMVILADGVTVDGLRVAEGAGGGAFELAGIHVQADNVTVQNSVFYRSAGGVGDASRAITTSVGSANGVSVLNNAMSGWHTGTFLNGATDATVQGNSYVGNLVGMSMDAYAGATGVDVSGNTFDNNLEDLGIGSVGGEHWAGSVSGNAFNGPGVFNYDSALPLTLVTGNTFYGSAADDETLTDDSTGSGRIGDNTLDGGGGTGDTADYSFATDTISVDFDAGTATGSEIGTDTGVGIENVVTGSGDDTVASGADDASASTGAGEDSFEYTTGDGNFTIDGGTDTDTLNVDGTGAASATSYDLQPGSSAGFDLTAGSNTVHGENVEDVNIDLSAHGDTVTIGDMTGTGIATSTITVTGGSGNDTVEVDPANPVNVEFTGNGGDDTFVGGAGDDTFNGGDGNDTFVGGTGDDAVTLDGTLEDYDVTVVDVSGTSMLQFTNTNGASSSFGDVDLIGLDVETVNFTDGDKIILVGGGTDNSSIQDAVDAASSGDTIAILPGAGSFTEDVLIDKSLNIVGGQFGVAGNDGTGLNAARSGGETVLLNSTFTIAADNVTIDGLRFDIQGAADTAIYVQNHTGLTIENTVIQGDGTPGSRGIEFQNLFSGDVTIDANFIDGLTSGIYVSGSGATITRNVISNNVAGIGTDNMSGATIANNLFDNNSSEAVGASSLGAGNEVSDNSFSGPGASGFIKADYTPGETDTLIADGNWYGTTDAATIAGLVSDNVLAADYLSSGIDDDAVAPGFQGEAAALVPTPVQNTTQGTGSFLLAPIVALAAAGNTIAVAAGDYSSESPITVDANNLTIDAVASATGVAFAMATATQLTLDGDADIDVTGDGDFETITGNDGDNVFYGSDGGDNLNGGNGFDTLDFGSQTSSVNVQFDVGGFGVASGSNVGVSQIDGFEAVRGGSAGDTLIGDANDNTFYASNGNDTINGMGGTNTYDGSDQTAAMFISLATGSASGSTISTDGLSNIANVVGGSGNDVIVGDGNANRLEGGGGTDNISGGLGADILVGGTNNDTLNGGNGDDTAVFSGLRSSYTIDFNAGTVTGADGTDTLTSIEYLQFDDMTIENVEVLPSIAKQDFNGNEAADILSATQATGYLSYRDGDAPGTEIGVGTLYGKTIVGIGDFNDDGVQDLLSRSDGGWYSFYDSANLTANVGIGRNDGKTALGVGDFDGDGKTDILFQSSSGYMTYLAGGNNSGTPEDIGRYDWPTAGNNDVLGIGDFDGDGVDDILFRSDGGWYSFLHGDSGGGAGLATRHDLGRNDGKDLVGIGDFNGDGKQDLLFSSSSGFYTYLEGRSDGDPVSTPQDLGRNDGTLANSDVTGIGDFNGDGKDDLLFLTPSGALSYLESDDGSSTKVALGSAFGYSVVGIDDYNGDGFDDVLLQDGAGTVNYATAGDMSQLVAVGDYSDLNILFQSFGLDVTAAMNDD